MEQPAAAGRCAELPGRFAGWDGDAVGHGCDSRCLAAGPWLCFRSPGTAEIGAHSIMLSACIEEETGCLKQATTFLSCLLSLPKLYRCREWEYPPATFPEAFLYLHFTVNWKINKTRERDSVRISWAIAVTSWGCLTLHILFSFCLTVAYISADNVLLEKLEVGIKRCATGWYSKAGGFSCNFAEASCFPLIFYSAFRDGRFAVLFLAYFLILVCFLHSTFLFGFLYF